MDPSARTWPLLAPEPRGRLVHRQHRPTLSVVIAAHQAERTLAAAIDSALGSTRPPDEVVVCDDGSTDGTADVLASYGGALTVVRQDNRGEGAAKNAAVQAARGEFVVVLDADDVFLPERTAALEQAVLRRPDLDVITTDAWVEVAGVSVARAYSRTWPFPTADQRAAMLSRNAVLGLAAVRRERWSAVGGFPEDLHHAADWDFFLRLVLAGSQMGLVDVPLARYRLRADGLSSSRMDVVRGRIAVLRRALARADLAEHERHAARRALHEQQRELRDRRAAEQLVSAGRGDGRPAPGLRRRAAIACVAGGGSWKRRAGLAVSVVAPAFAARAWAARSPGEEIGTGLRVDATGRPLGAQAVPEELHEQAVVWARGPALRVGGRAVAQRHGAPVAQLVTDPASGPALPALPAELAVGVLRATGVAVHWTDPVVLPRARLLSAARQAGRDCGSALPREPCALRLSRLGSWHDAPPWLRAMRRAPVLARLPFSTDVREDLSFWAGVRERATDEDFAGLVARTAQR